MVARIFSHFFLSAHLNDRWWPGDAYPLNFARTEVEALLTFDSVPENIARDVSWDVFFKFFAHPLSVLKDMTQYHPIEFLGSLDEGTLQWLTLLRQGLPLLPLSPDPFTSGIIQRPMRPPRPFQTADMFTYYTTPAPPPHEVESLGDEGSEMIEQDEEEISPEEEEEESSAVVAPRLPGESPAGVSVEEVQHQQATGGRQESRFARQMRKERLKKHHRNRGEGQEEEDRHVRCGGESNVHKQPAQPAPELTQEDFPPLFKHRSTAASRTPDSSWNDEQAHEPLESPLYFGDDDRSPMETDAADSSEAPSAPQRPTI